MDISQAVPYRTAWEINLVTISMESGPIARFMTFRGTGGYIVLERGE